MSERWGDERAAQALRRGLTSPGLLCEDAEMGGRLCPRTETATCHREPIVFRRSAAAARRSDAPGHLTLLSNSGRVRSTLTDAQRGERQHSGENSGDQDAERGVGSLRLIGERQFRDEQRDGEAHARGRRDAE